MFISRWERLLKYHFIMHKVVKSTEERNYRKALCKNRKYPLFCCFSFCVLSNLPLVSLQSLFSPTCFSYASQYVSRYEAQGEGMQTSDLHQTKIFGLKPIETFFFTAVFLRHSLEQLVHLAHFWRHRFVRLAVLANAHRLHPLFRHRGLHPHGLPR